MIITTPDKNITDFFEKVSRKDLFKCSLRRYILSGESINNCPSNYKITRCVESVDTIRKIMDGEIFQGRNSELSFFDDSVVFLELNRKYNLLVIKDKIDGIKLLAERLGENPELIRTILEEGTDKYYHTFNIWKDEARTKKRTISAPNQDLKRIQGKILKSFLYMFGTTTQSHAFVHGKSIVTNAIPHLSRKYILKMDLKDFFPSITKDMIIGALYPFLMRKHYSYIDIIAELCCLNGVLPQGAPTSPALSNIIGGYIDVCIEYVLEKYNIRAYTRYADDMTFSSNVKINPKFMKCIYVIIKKLGLKVNSSKTKIYSVGMRHKVTGIIVNGETSSIPRKERMKFRALLHNIQTGKIQINNEIKNHIKGKYSFFFMVNPAQAEKFKSTMDEILC
ncbi:MAG: reverse transcriptase family protein [Melioribacteraceae bacterium]|nr:reverse transcriptase family protein [Melioribacteraceae bacterium]